MAAKSNWPYLPTILETSIEIIAVVLSLVFLVLLIKEVVWCWPFGIVSSMLSIYLFIEARLYSEAILYGFYVVIGIYGWWVWTTPKSNSKPLAVAIQTWKGRLGVFLLGLVGAIALGQFFSRFTDAANPHIDATTTSFSFVASFLEAHKLLSAWIYWILINAASVWLYQERGLPIYSLLMVIYTGVSIFGWFDWRKKLPLQRA